MTPNRRNKYISFENVFECTMCMTAKIGQNAMRKIAFKTEKSEGDGETVVFMGLDNGCVLRFKSIVPIFGKASICICPLQTLAI